MRRRLLLSMDSSSRGRRAVHWAVRAAEALHLDLTGLFLEDERILRTASLPVTKELGLLRGDLRTLETITVERHLRRQAREAETLLKRMTQTFHLSYSFETIRGEPFQALHSRKQPDDVLLLGFFDTRVHAIHWASQPDGPVAVFLDDDRHALPALTVAERLARKERRPLLVLHPASAAPSVAEWTARLQVRLHVQAVSGIEQLIKQCRLFHADLLVLPDGDHTADPAYLPVLAGEIPVLLV